MSDDPFSFFVRGTQRSLRNFCIVRHHTDGDRQMCFLWSASFEEVAIEASTTLAIQGWHIESIIMNCDGLTEDEIWQEVERENFDNEFYKIIDQYDTN